MKMPEHAFVRFMLASACAAFMLPVAVATEQGADTEASPPAAAAPRPCRQDDRFREFDFWAGEWDVRTADGRLAGRNVIEVAHDGCLLIENWSGAGGSTGTSMNYLDKATAEWVQVWIDSSGSQINIRGGITEAGMLLEGEIHYVATGTTAPFRGLWTLQEDGRIRQYFEQSNDEGNTWQPWFEGFYSRAGQASSNRTDESKSR